MVLTAKLIHVKEVIETKFMSQCIFTPLALSKENLLISIIKVNDDEKNKINDNFLNLKNLSKYSAAGIAQFETDTEATIQELEMS